MELTLCMQTPVVWTVLSSSLHQTHLKSLQSLGGHVYCTCRVPVPDKGCVFGLVAFYWCEKNRGDFNETRESLLSDFLLDSDFCV